MIIVLKSQGSDHKGQRSTLVELLETLAGKLGFGMIFSKATGYGIRALAYLARRPDSALCGLQEIAEHEHIPPVYLRKVLGELRRHRLLHSVKGIHGGYALARPPKAITLWEVFQVLEPDPYLDACILGRGQCNHEASCALHDDWQKVRTALVGLMETKTIWEVSLSVSTQNQPGVSQT